MDKPLFLQDNRLDCRIKFFYRVITAVMMILASSGVSKSEILMAEVSPSHSATQSIMAVIAGGPFNPGDDPDAAYHQCEQLHPRTCRLSWFSDEAPVRQITLDTFQIDVHEVTQRQYEKIMGNNPSKFSGPNRPVERVTWYEAEAYCRKIGKRLPTEAEWEKAARGGASTTYAWGNSFVPEKANHCDRSCKERWRETNFNDGFAYTAPVGSFPPNDYGIYDMAGNVYEWVSDWYDEDYYKSRPARNPRGPNEGGKKIIRGGSWINFSVGLRPGDRTAADPDDRMEITGFRCAQ